MNISARKVVVIGGAGLVGSHIVDLLAGEDVGEIVVFDNFARGTRRNLAATLERSGRVRVVQGSVTDRDHVRRELKGADGVFLLAALWLGECVADPRSAVEVNVVGT